jgi:hypothetical protein
MWFILLCGNANGKEKEEENGLEKSLERGQDSFLTRKLDLAPLRAA